VSPQTDNFCLLSFVVLWLGGQNVLNNLGKVSHVELIEELSGCGGELGVLGHVSKHSLGGLDDHWSLLLSLFIEFLKVIDKELRVDSRQDFFLGHGQTNSCQVTGATHVNEERSGFRVHAANEHAVSDSLLD
jgi:hypothetical protein